MNDEEVIDQTEWSEEDIRKFRDEFVSDDNDPPTVHPGTVLTGIVLTLFAIYGAYIQQIEFVAFTLGLLTILALGSKYINE